ACITLASFPTRRSSDLARGAGCRCTRLEFRNAVLPVECGEDDFRTGRQRLAHDLEKTFRSDGGCLQFFGKLGGFFEIVRRGGGRSEEHTSELQSRENLV